MAFADAKDAYDRAVAGLKSIKTDYPGTEEARKAEELLLSYCQIEKASVDSKREREAESKLRLAKAFFDRGKTSDGIRWLKDIVTAYEETEAGKEAARLLKMWTE